MHPPRDEIERMVKLINRVPGPISAWFPLIETYIEILDDPLDEEFVLMLAVDEMANRFKTA
jgi:hypothetical protein